MKTKISIFTVLLVFLFYLSLFIAGFLPLISEYKTELSPFVILDYTRDIILHPILNIKEMYAVENPMLFLSMGAALFLYIFLIYKSRPKDYENVGDKYGVQGSSRWAKKAEIFNVPEQITVIPSKDMFNEIKKTLKKEV